MRNKRIKLEDLYISPDELRDWSNYPSPLFSIISVSIALLLTFPSLFYITPSCKSEKERSAHLENLVSEQRKKCKGWQCIFNNDPLVEEAQSQYSEAYSTLASCIWGKQILTILFSIILIPISSYFMCKFILSFSYKRFSSHHQTMIKLHEKVKKFNESVHHIAITGYLESIGNKIDFDKHKNEAIEILDDTRKNLKIALETDRVLRENPNYNPDNFSLDLDISIGQDISDKIVESSEIIKEIVNINSELKKEMNRYGK